MPAIEFKLKLHGPLFTGRARATAIRAIKGGVRELVENGEQRLDQMLRPRPMGVFLSVAEAQRGKASTGNYRRNVNAKFQGLQARIDDGGVVYGPWLELGRAGTRFRGYASFRRTRDFLDKEKKAVFRRHIAKAVRELN